MPRPASASRSCPAIEEGQVRMPSSINQKSHQENPMTLSRRTLLKVGGAAAALPLVGGKAFAQAEPLKVGFIYVGTINDNGYNYGHNQGRLFLEEALGDAVETTYVENVP